MKNPFSAIASSLGGDSGRLVDPYLALPMAAALIGGNGNSGGMSNALMAGMYGMQARRERQDQQAQRNQTLEYFMNNRPDLYEQVQAGLPVSEAFKLMNQKPDHTDDMREYQMAQQQGFQGNFMDYMTTIRRAGADRNTSVGSIPQGFQLQETADGLRMVPIPGGPEDTSEQDALKAKAKATSTDLVLDEIDLAKQIIGSKPGSTTGILGGLLSNIDSTTAGALKNRLTTIKANIGFDKLQAMRDASPTGGALGQVSEFENRLLQSVYGSLEQSQRPEDILYNLQRLEDIYNQIVNTGIPADQAREMYRQEVLRSTGAGGQSDDGWTVEEVQ